MSNRLTKRDWIEHGVRTLAEGGTSALSVGAMSLKLKVSRGSFYWHFRDVADFRWHILQSWHERTTDQVIRELETGTDADRLKQLFKRGFGGTRSADQGETLTEYSLEKAVRAWATKDEAVAAIVASVDASRIAFIAQLLVTAGVAAKQASPRAAFIYWAYLGRNFQTDAVHSSISTAALSDISGLFEREV